jgi:adenosylhomocysteine nucleosidase
VSDEIKTIHYDIHFSDYEDRGSRRYYIGKLNDIELVLVNSGVGKVAGSITATARIEYFKVDKIIFTGLAGAVADNLERGDIILGNKTYQHDYDCRPLAKNQFEIPFTGQGLLELNKSDVILTEQSIQLF